MSKRSRIVRRRQRAYERLEAIVMEALKRAAIITLDGMLAKRFMLPTEQQRAFMESDSPPFHADRR